MEIFVDSANVEKIRELARMGVIDGVTTNPTICLKCGVSGGMAGIKQRTIEIAKSLSAARTKETVAQFIGDAKKSMEQLK